jgi:hypothetical protein
MTLVYKHVSEIRHTFTVASSSPIARSNRRSSAGVVEAIESVITHDSEISARAEEYRELLTKSPRLSGLFTLG